jgi:hypothetical protein
VILKINNIKKNISIFSLIFLSSCVNGDYFKYGKVSFHATTDKNFFVFTVDDNFYKKYKNSPNNKTHPRLSDEEFKMLKALLKNKKYCVENSINPQFEIISRQEKVFDATFSKLIAENYNAKPLTPVSYSGKCIISS